MRSPVSEPACHAVPGLFVARTSARERSVRDQGLLEAALYRPQTGYYADLIE
jgi:hypothetical protein